MTAATARLIRSGCFSITPRIDGTHGPGEVPRRQRKDQRPLALALRNLREIFREREDAEPPFSSVAFGPSVWRVDDNDLVGRAGQRRDQCVGRRIREDVGSRTTFALRAGAERAAGARACRGRRTGRESPAARERRVLILRVRVGDVGPAKDHRDRAGLLKRREVVDARRAPADRVREFLTRRIDAPRLIDLRPFARVGGEVDERDLALRGRSRVKFGLRAGVDNLAG